MDLSEPEAQAFDMMGGTPLGYRERLDPFRHRLRGGEANAEQVAPVRLKPVFGYERTRQEGTVVQIQTNGEMMQNLVDNLVWDPGDQEGDRRDNFLADAG